MKQSIGYIALVMKDYDEVWRDYHEMVSLGIEFVRQPKEAPYGTVAVFKDLYGNLWDLLQVKK